MRFSGDGSGDGGAGRPDAGGGGLNARGDEFQRSRKEPITIIIAVVRLDFGAVVTVV